MNTVPELAEQWTAWDDEDPLLRQLRLTVRQALAEADGSPERAWRALSELGVGDFGLPVAAGGLELGQTVLAMVCEEVGRSAQPVPLMGTFVALSLLSSSGSRPDLLERVRDGGLPVAVPGRLPGLSRASRFGGGLVWTPNGSGRTVRGTAGPFSVVVEPGALLVIAAGADGPCAGVVPLPDPTVALRLLADHGGGPTALAVLDGTPLPDDSVLFAGEAAERELTALGVRTAVYQAALLTGLTTATLRAVVDRVRSRRQFGTSVSRHQAPRLRVAGLLARLDAMRWSIVDAARCLDRGTLGGAEAAGLLALTAETALDVSRDAVHLHGAAGLARETTVASCYRRVAWEALRCGRPALLWEAAAGPELLL